MAQRINFRTALEHETEHITKDHFDFRKYWVFGRFPASRSFRQRTRSFAWFQISLGLPKRLPTIFEFSLSRIYWCHDLGDVSASSNRITSVTLKSFAQFGANFRCVIKANIQVSKGELNERAPMSPDIIKRKGKSAKQKREPDRHEEAQL